MDTLIFETAGSARNDMICSAVKDAKKFKQLVMNAKKNVESGNPHQDGSGGPQKVSKPAQGSDPDSDPIKKKPIRISNSDAEPESKTKEAERYYGENRNSAETVRLLAEIKDLLEEQNKILSAKII
jgi:hypothetical protein